MIGIPCYRTDVKALVGCGSRCRRSFAFNRRSNGDCHAGYGCVAAAVAYGAVAVVRVVAGASVFVAVTFAGVAGTGAAGVACGALAIYTFTVFFNACAVAEEAGLFHVVIIMG